VEFQEKTISGKNFRNFRANQGYLLPKLVKFHSTFSNFLFCVRIAQNNFNQVLSYVVYAQLRRHVHKQITKRRYGEEKLERFVFEKPVLFTLGLGLSKPYSLGVLV